MPPIVHRSDWSASRYICGCVRSSEKTSQTEAVLQQLRKQGVLMLRACGTGVAVSNALAEVKEAADVVCLSNEEDGVALWLAEHVLREDCVSKKFGMVKIKEY